MVCTVFTTVSVTVCMTDCMVCTIFTTVSVVSFHGKQILMYLYMYTHCASHFSRNPDCANVVSLILCATLPKIRRDTTTPITSKIQSRKITFVDHESVGAHDDMTILYH